jgi:oligoribonuclease NrnB/cAMP/cGMP phosphodiesterase (DHH superfamily)
MSEKRIVVIYHKKCPDGFGAAYAAWKKFGDTAEYVPVGYGDEAPEDLAGKEVYLLDFSFELPGEMERLAKVAARFVALDHHQSSKELTESAPEHIYDANRSGATIAWSFFHPDTPTPKLLRFIEDGDLYRYALPETHDVFSYLVVQPDDFSVWDAIAEKVEQDDTRAELLTKAAAYSEYFELLAKLSVEAAKKVSFEGYECYFTTAMPSITMRSYVGNQLYTKLPPLALVVTAHPDGFGVSIRSDGSVDVAAIAAKYGGGGHPGSAGFFIPNGTEMPWVEIED